MCDRFLPPKQMNTMFASVAEPTIEPTRLEHVETI